MMNKGLFIARKNHLYCVIKKLSDGCSGDSIDVIKTHFNEVLEAYPDDAIEDAIKCYEEMVDKLKYYPERI